MLSEQHHAALVDQPLDPELLAAPVVEEGAGGVHLDLQPPLAVVVESLLPAKPSKPTRWTRSTLEEAHQQREARRRHLVRRGPSVRWARQYVAGLHVNADFDGSIGIR